MTCLISVWQHVYVVNSARQKPSTVGFTLDYVYTFPFHFLNFSIQLRVRLDRARMHFISLGQGLHVHVRVHVLVGLGLTEKSRLQRVSHTSLRFLRPLIFCNPVNYTYVYY